MCLVAVFLSRDLLPSSNASDGFARVVHVIASLQPYFRRQNEIDVQLTHEQNTVDELVFGAEQLLRNQTERNVDLKNTRRAKRN